MQEFLPLTVTDTIVIRLRRSHLYMPGANARALEKSLGLASDGVILDLEDAVAPDAKNAARDQVAAAVERGGYGRREVIVRVNGLDTPWGHDDVDVFGRLAGRLNNTTAPLNKSHLPTIAAPAQRLDGLLFPKVESAQQVRAIRARLAAVGAAQVPLWVMIETPKGVLAAAAIAQADPLVATLVLGTTDLVAALRARHTPGRTEVLSALSHCVLVARATNKCVLDGVHLDFRNLETFGQACEQARDLGFDGKTLIHPDQIATANNAFGVTAKQVEDARRLLLTWNSALQEGKGVTVLDGKLIEGLHVYEAERVLAIADELVARHH